MFKATKLINQKTFEIPKAKDSEGKLASRPGDILDIVSKYFKDKFVESDQDVIQPFQKAAKSSRKKNNSTRAQKKL